MNKQRGIADLWLVVIGGLALLGLLSGLVYGVTSYLTGVDQKGYDRGVKESEAKYAKRDNEALRLANIEIQTLHTAARAKEQAHQADMDAIETKRLQEVQRAKDQRDHDIAAVVAGTIKLRDPGQTAAGADSGGQRPGSEAGASAGKCDGRAGGQLSPAASRFLLELANEADDVTRQLGSCQAVINADRATINGP